eukprot:6319300-Amphidinium_carterae.1
MGEHSFQHLASELSQHAERLSKLCPEHESIMLRVSMRGMQSLQLSLRVLICILSEEVMATSVIRELFEGGDAQGVHVFQKQESLEGGVHAITV